jgi:hypothetical protein
MVVVNVTAGNSVTVTTAATAAAGAPVETSVAVSAARAVCGELFQWCNHEHRNIGPRFPSASAR